MTYNMITIPTATAQPVPCGQTPNGGVIGCTLDMLVQPHFFCGQFLTDQDLLALLHWGQNKFRLARYRHGWGVVCGLEVYCAPQANGNGDTVYNGNGATSHASQVMVSPGYALSCCGDDIILTQAYPVSLADVCRREPDPCEPRARRSVAGEGTQDAPLVQLFGCEWPADEIRMVDLYLQYQEEEAEPKATLGRNACSQQNECEPSRKYEKFTIIPQIATINSDPAAAAAERWNAAYTQSLALIPAFRTWWQRAGQPTGSEIRDWLSNWIKAHPLHQFCSLWDCLCKMDDDEFSEARAVQIVFWLALDYRNAALACDCATCLDGSGVPLGRVWLHIGKTDAQRTCRVLAIDTAPPYRRLLSPACWPAPLGQANAGPLIWRRLDEACAMLGALGIQMSGAEHYPLPTSGNELDEAQAMFAESLFVPCGQNVTVRWVKMEQGLGNRVVGFRREDDDESMPYGSHPPERAVQLAPLPPVQAVATGGEEEALSAPARRAGRRARS